MSLAATLRFITKHPLNRGNAYGSLARYAKWQFRSRLLPGDVVHEWVEGSKFRVRAGESGLTQHIYTGLQDFADMGYVLHALRGGDLFADIGSNSGAYTILACAVAGARGFAFEPVPETYGRLVENIRLNELEDRVTCLNMALGKAEGIIAFTSRLGTANHVVASGEHDPTAINVRITTLDKALDGQSPSMLKIDVEGYETPALEGAQETLRKPSLNSVIMELNECGSQYGHPESGILGMMFDHGFKACSYDPLTRQLTGLNGKNAASANTIFIRDLSLASERIAAARTFQVLGKNI